jgi:two-component system, NarL family, nitrate/nitrite response regulator NarL
MNAAALRSGLSSGPGVTGVQGQKPIRVMIVDDHHCVLWGLERLIEGERPRMELVAKARTPGEAVDLAGRTAPDVVVLDLDLGGENGVDIIPALLQRSPTRVLILTGKRETKVRDLAILRGASGIVEKTDDAEVILKAIQKVHGGELWLDRAATARVFVEFARPRPAGDDEHAQRLAELTAREREILALVASAPASDNRGLARALRLGEHTLRNHLSRIYDKLGVGNRFELYLYAQKHGLGKSTER